MSKEIYPLASRPSDASSICRTPPHGEDSSQAYTRLGTSLSFPVCGRRGLQASAMVTPTRTFILPISLGVTIQASMGVGSAGPGSYRYVITLSRLLGRRVTSSSYPRNDVYWQQSLESSGQLVSIQALYIDAVGSI